MRGKLHNIQGLRAFAVIAVVLFHLWPGWLPGGYIGVDVFFVISGFLITGHLRREVKITGRIRLADFWARRARRLLPAAMAVLVFCLAVNAVLVPITGRESVYKQILAAGTYALNWVLAATSLDYFASGSSWSPVTHYWSLSVEEQFYIAWPLLIVASLWLTRKSTSHVRNVTIIAGFVLIFAASFAWAVYSVKAHPSAAYFETTSHAWEFAIGGLLTFIPTPRTIQLRLIAPIWLAWAVLLGATFFLNSASNFPGPLALIPVLATALILWNGDFAHRYSLDRIISAGPIQFLGDVSYSLYLWHWPLIFTAPLILGRGITAVDKVVILLISLVVAYASKRFVEDPIRESKRKTLSGTGWIFATTAASIAVLVAFTGLSSINMNQRATLAAQALFTPSLNPGPCFGAQAVLSGAHCAQSHLLASKDTVLVDWNHQINGFQNGTACQADRGAPVVLTCAFGAPEATARLGVALVGDSHAAMWATALNSTAVTNNMRIKTYLESGCPATLDPRIVYAADFENANGCRTWREAAISQIANDKAISLVVTSSKDQSYVGAPDKSGKRLADTGSGYVAAWKLWLNAGKRVLVINEIPERSSAVPNCIAARLSEPDPCTVPSNVISGYGPLAKAAAQIRDPNFTFIDFHHVLCDISLCHSVVGGIPAYIDSDHISAPFARSFAPQLAPLVTTPGPGPWARAPGE